MKIANLYPGIGGNRSLWGDEHEITAVELNESIAQVYADRFPKDKVVIGDAHQFLLDHYLEFDFVWSSPPCPTHSKARFWSSKGGRYEVAYPDMKLYQEITFLKHFFEGKWVTENVQAYYDPLIKPTATFGRHWIWANFNVGRFTAPSNYIFNGEDFHRVEKMLGIDLSNYKLSIRKDKVLRNCTHPEIGKHLLDRARGIMNEGKVTQVGLFENNYLQD